MTNTRLLPLSVALLVVAVSCQRSPAPAATPAPAASAAPVTVEPAAPPQGPAPLALVRNSDGTVQLKGSDRWGKPIDVTYENVEWLKKAAPVVSRGLAPEQAAQLEKDLAGL